MNYSIIGIGQAGCAITTLFSNFPEHYNKFYRIDTEEQVKKENCIDIHLVRQPKPEDYEKVSNLKKHFKKLNSDVLFIVAGGGNVSLSSLAILEQIKDKTNISVLYIRPDIEFLGAEGKLKEKTTFNIFQEYARSGLFKRLYIVSNIEIEKAMGGVSIISYYEKINETILSTFHMMNVFQKMKPVTSTFSDLPIGTRISTIGLIDVDSKEEKMFFNLDLPTDSVYYFAYNEVALKEDVKLLNHIKNMIRNKVEIGVARVSYGIYATSYDREFIIVANHTSFLQN